MNDGKTVFAQRFGHIPINDFRKSVRNTAEHYPDKLWRVQQHLRIKAFFGIYEWRAPGISPHSGKE
jgi:hypothetical protein